MRAWKCHKMREEEIREAGVAGNHVCNGRREGRDEERERGEDALSVQGIQ